MTDPAPAGPSESYNPWSIVNLVFHHLADAGPAPGPRRGGDPGAPAAELLRALGIEPAAEGNRQANSQAVRARARTSCERPSSAE